MSRNLRVHHTTVGGGCCRGRDRRRTDGVRSRSAVLQRERLGNVCLSPGNVPIKTSRPMFSTTPPGTCPI